MDELNTELVDHLADLIINARRIVVFTGAGVSTESGIPDFRSPGGLWDRFNPDDFTYQKFLTSEESRKKAWRLFRDKTFVEARPNPAHYAIAELERIGKLDYVITQNVDGLHQQAGSSEDKVIQLHGTMKWVRCLQCGKRFPRDEIEQWLDHGVQVPHCDECAGLLKSETVSFGQPMPVRETTQAEERSRQCDLFIVVGSSLVVYPAAQMPRYALQGGAKLVIINLAGTDLDGYATLAIRGKAGEVMSRVVERVKSKLGSTT